MVQGHIERDRQPVKKKGAGSVRIIGGKWRGRRLPIADLPGLRPSGDRCRETLFNWLQPYVRGARCIDLFAGTGALGLEAASRGAAEVILVEKLAPAAAAIRENVEMLDAVNVELIEADAISWLQSREPRSMDIVFIDPPFGTGLEVRSFEIIRSGDCVNTGGLVYVETARVAPLINPGADWEMAREKTLGEVRMQLLKKI